MVTRTLVARWALGGTFAVIAGLAASAEPLAPVAPLARPASHISPISAVVAPPLRLAAPVVTRASLVRPPARPGFIGAAQWDDRQQGKSWSRAALRAIAEAPQDLRDIVPADIGTWCPAYEGSPPELRAAFWIGTFSVLARLESTFDEEAVGGGGAWHGLMQISPATARFVGCEAQSGEALRDGTANLRCAARIAARAVARDGVVSAGGGGIAAEWGPMSRERPRALIREWVSAQSYCVAPTAVMASLRPLARPEPVVASLLPGDLRTAGPAGASR